ncbi:Zona pellucida sperm-binding protein 3 receptor [Nestor notabilis]|uniref:Zona pellucida sperm-binding protein 3 receptor n=1 Tax=Nestor notabilis TaxID=176057 RepID=A0A091RXF7_NESNO|nr:Zona pellucida sperm-binding protein 3 receptor [Nestor notabilis]
MPRFLCWLGQLLAVVVLVLQPAGSRKVQCPVPDITHGQLEPAQNFTSGSTATLKCDTGYMPLGATSSVSLGNGRWPPRVPACIPGHCSYPPVIDHTDRNHQREFPVGTTVTYSCRSGYTLVPGVSPVTTCLQNFTWTSIPKLCQKVQCPSPDIQHGREISPRKDEYSFGHQVEFQCELGYVLRGNQRIQCWSDGTWRPPVPYCDKVCGPPPKIANGQHTSLGTELFPYGSEVKYSCVEGLSLIGDDSIYCTSDDGVSLAWSGPAPECRVVRCPRPVVEKGRMTPQSFTFPYGSPVPFSCVEGVVRITNFVGSFSIYIMMSLLLSYLLLWVILSVLCPQPHVANGRLNSTLDGQMWYQTNETVTFECFHGYHLSDLSLTATCLPDGSWTPLPKCKKDGDADVCEELHYITTVFECGVPIAEVKTLLEIKKLFLEIKKLNLELENLNK